MTDRSRVLVTGGRTFGEAPWPPLPDRAADRSARAAADAQRRALWERLDALQPAEVAQGGAAGADRVVRRWAAARGVPCRTYPADWRRLGKLAGRVRNEQMYRDFGPSLVLACPGGRGTAHMVEVAERHGCPLMRLDVTAVTE